jgi:hypothetical protein
VSEQIPKLDGSLLDLDIQVCAVSLQQSSKALDLSRLA